MRLHLLYKFNKNKLKLSYRVRLAKSGSNNDEGRRRKMRLRLNLNKMNNLKLAYSLKMILEDMLNIDEGSAYDKWFQFICMY